MSDARDHLPDAYPSLRAAVLKDGTVHPRVPPRISDSVSLASAWPCARLSSHAVHARKNLELSFC